MIDVTCKCGKRIGWHGTMRDRPPCPRCGHQIDRAVLEAVAAKMDESERLMLLHPSEANPGDLKAMRKLAGLSRLQASTKLVLSVDVLVDWENGIAKPTRDQCDTLAELYGCG